MRRNLSRLNFASLFSFARLCFAFDGADFLFFCSEGGEENARARKTRRERERGGKVSLSRSEIRKRANERLRLISRPRKVSFRFASDRTRGDFEERFFASAALFLSSFLSTRLSGFSRGSISLSRVKLTALSLFLSHLVQKKTGSRAAFASTAAAKPVSGFQFHVEAKQNKVARTILTQKQRTYNKARKSEIATRIKKVRTLAEVLLPSATEENVAELEKLISEATKTVDKAVAKGVLHKNTGARRKSRMARMKQGVLKANNLMTYN